MRIIVIVAARWRVLGRKVMSRGPSSTAVVEQILRTLILMICGTAGVIRTYKSRTADATASVT